MSASMKTVPRHVAIIMDGNGRWAKARGLARIKGHQAGAQAVRETVEACGELKVEYLTLYAFSAENWQRPKTEVIALMRLLEKFLRDKTPELIEKNVRLPAKCAYPISCFGRLPILRCTSRRSYGLTSQRKTSSRQWKNSGAASAATVYCCSRNASGSLTEL